MAPKQQLTVAIAPDSFKGSLTALEAARCIEKGLKKALPGARFRLIPMADGGDGTVTAIVDATGGRLLSRTVHGPRQGPVKASFGVTGDGKTAVIEMAAASGLTLLRPNRRNPLLTTTFGTGELIRHALDLNVARIMIGIGGSATNDGGTGMAVALGIRFLDSRGRSLPGTGKSLGAIRRIDSSGLDPRIGTVKIEVACDVDNPLTGPRGAARVYGPQKGATPAMVKLLDAGLGNLARIIRKDLGLDVARRAGAGAAGGLGAGLMAFLGGRLRPGVDIVMDAVQLRARIKGCDLVVTGEGRIDGQAAFGKAPVGVSRAARKLNIPVIAVAGSIGPGADAVLKEGVLAYFSALERPVAELDLRKYGPAMLTSCAEQVGRVLNLRLERLK